MPPSEQRDVVVIGGGPAGATAAALIAREGIDVVLLDRERFPRFRIGESLMPATYWTLERLGVLEGMKTSSFPRKHSVQFFSKDGRSSAPFYFSEFDSHESSATWQVDRRDFDQMLLDNARSSGVEVREQANVLDVPMVGDRADGVVVAEGDVRKRIECKVVVDAAGQSSILSRKLSLKTLDPRLRHTSYFTRYRGAKRDTGIDEGATLILRTRSDQSWFWFIPLPDDVVSVGVVGPVEYLTSRGSDPQTVYDEELEACARLRERLVGAEQVEPVRVLRDFSYVSKRIAGDGWVLSGDAFGFLDPIYSSGVFLALKSGEMTADSVVRAFAAKDFGAEALGRHGDEYLAGMEAMRKLVYAYYHPQFSVARFLKANPEYRKAVVNLLVGNVFRFPVDGLFEAMGREIDLPEARRLASAGELR